MTLQTLVLVTLISICQLFSGATATKAFGCRSSEISDEWRDMVFNLHNGNRRKLAKGDFEGSGDRKLPVAKNMNQMTWDCNIEQLAIEKAQECSDEPVVPAPYGAATGLIPITGACNPVAMGGRAMQFRWDEGGKKQANQAVIANNHRFSQMSFYKNSAFACVYRKCPRGLYLLCIFNQKYGDVGSNLYEPCAAPAEICSNCDRIGGGEKYECVNSLCQPPFSPAILASKVCEGCLPPMTDDARNTALNMHNYYRRTLATGWAEDGKEGVQHAPRAKAMAELKYDRAREDAAKLIVDACPNMAAGEPGGKNFFKVENHQIDPKDALEQAIESWWSPLKTIGLGADTAYTEAIKGNAMKTFANMAHDKSTKIGCAVKNCREQGYTVVDCHYDPAIADGALIYEKGKPCQCTDGQSCTELGGLCKIP